MEPSAIPVYGISIEQKKQLSTECNINTCKELIENGRTPEQRQLLARKLSVEKRSVDLWVKQADLLRVEGMSSELTYYLVHTGIRSVADLARISTGITKNALQAAINAHPFIEYEAEEIVENELDPPPSQVSSNCKYDEKTNSITISGNKDQYYLVTDSFKIPTNWRRSIEGSENMTLSLNEIKHPVVFSRKSPGKKLDWENGDQLLTCSKIVLSEDGSANAESLSMLVLSQPSVRMKLGQVQENNLISFADILIAIFGKGSQNRNQRFTLADPSNSISFYEDRECSKPVTSELPIGTSFYMKANKPTPCSQFFVYVNGEIVTTGIYQIKEESYVQLVNKQESAPEITEELLEALKNNAIRMNPESLITDNLGTVYPDLPPALIDIIKDKIDDDCIIVTDETEPAYLFDYDNIMEILDRKTDSEIISEGLCSLREINIALPLPKYFCCRATFRSKDDKKAGNSIQVSGLKVEVTGIINPDTDESDVLTAYTDSTGLFMIDLPDKYSMQECLTFTFSRGSNKQVFNVLSSDIIRDSVIYNFDASHLSTAELLNSFQEIDDLNNSISDLKNMIDLADDVITLQNSMSSIISKISATEAELKKENLTESKKKELHLQLQYYNNEYNKKKDFADQIIKRLDETETDIKKIRSSYSRSYNKKVSERRELIISIFVTDPTTKENERTLSHLLSLLDMAWCYGTKNNEEGFVIIEELFNNYREDYSKALPSVKLMGEDEGAVWLPTDRASSRVYNYSLLQRLVEPTVDPPAESYNGTSQTLKQRIKLTHPVDITDFRDRFSRKTGSYPKSSSLGMGYTLNMRQSWVPDGFALGTLLYSLILAPGEEQKLIIREKSQSYNITDNSTGTDSVSESQSREQGDEIQAMYDYVMAQESEGSSHSDYSSKSGSFGATLTGGVSFIMGGLTGGYAHTSGNANSHSLQTNNHNEASQAAQSFNHKLAGASNKLQEANRVSITSASSDVSNSVATKIIANHNHSHAMTVQYWEVVRRFRLETSIESVDLVLYVPLDPVCFLPADEEPDLDYYSKFAAWSDDSAENEISRFMDIKRTFNKRYERIMQYYDTLRNTLPYKYRSGLDLIQKFYTLPYFKVDRLAFDISSDTYSITVIGGFCEFDNLTATLYFNNGSNPVNGSVYTEYEELYYIKAGEDEKTVSKKAPHSRKEVRAAICTARAEKNGKAVITFRLPYGTTKDNIASLVIKNDIPESWSYELSRNKDALEEWENNAIDKYLDWMENRYKDTTDFDKDDRNIAKFASGLPEWFVNPIATFTAGELNSFGSLRISVYETDSYEPDKYTGTTTATADNSVVTLETTNYEELSKASLIYNVPLKANAVTYTYDNGCPRLSIKDLQRMEETFRHIVSENFRYSKAIWQSLTSDELAMMLEQYTIDMDFDTYFDVDKKTDLQIPLLNCINVKKPMGFYGNCILFPFTYPERLAGKLGKTAAEIQDSLYRYHAYNFRSPSTVISVPTEGMIGEAVLGATNVSEKIDITRFWNWKDSDLQTDHMSLDKEYLDSTDYLSEKKANQVNPLNLTGPSALSPAENKLLLSALMGRPTPQFNDMTGHDLVSNLLTKGMENNSSAINSNINSAQSAVDKLVALMTKNAEEETKRKEKEEEEKTKQAQEEAKKAEADAKKAEADAKIAEAEAAKAKAEAEIAAANKTK